MDARESPLGKAWPYPASRQSSRGFVGSSKVFRVAWKIAARNHAGLINLESDIVPTDRAFEDVLRCREQLCMVPYEIYSYDTGKIIGYSATIETRVPMGWDAHLARGGETWAVAGDMGFLRFGSGLIGGLDIDQMPEITANHGLLNQVLYLWLKQRLHTENIFHLHWPALKNWHVYWDSGDAAHSQEGSEHWKRPRLGDTLNQPKA